MIANRTGDVQHEARWVATVYFKNCINRCWRVKRDGSCVAYRAPRSSPRACARTLMRSHLVEYAPPAVSAANWGRSAVYDRGVTAEEKAHLRAKLLELVREDSPQVAIQLALIVAKVARTDYPREWYAPAASPRCLSLSRPGRSSIRRACRNKKSKLLGAPKNTRSCVC